MHNIEMSSYAYRRQQLITSSRGDLNAVSRLRPAAMNCVEARPRCTLGVVVYTLCRLSTLLSSATNINGQMCEKVVL